MKKKTFIYFILLLAAFAGMQTDLSAQYKSTFSGDLLVNPDNSYDYKFARVAVAYDGTIYIGRVYKAASNSNYDSYEILKSVDGGLSFDPFYSIVLGPNNVHYTAFDMVAAGNNIADFKLFVASSHLYDNGDAAIKLRSINAAGTSANIPLSLFEYNYPTRGFEDISLATDSKNPNGSANPFSLSLVAIKAGVNDSIIVWTDNDGGTNLFRNGIYGTSGFIRHISASIGSAFGSNIGRLGIAWDQFSGSSAPWGAVYLRYLDPTDGFSVADGGPYFIGILGSCRKPSVALSLSNTHSDISTCIVFETDGGVDGSDVVCRADDDIIVGTPNFSAAPFVGAQSGDQVDAHVVYNAAADSFMITYYNEANTGLVYKTLPAVDITSSSSTPVNTNYRNASTSLSNSRPRVDGISSGHACFVWNSGDETYFDSESDPTSVQNTSISIAALRLYPNPATDNITLTFTAEEKDNATLIITDISGKTVQSTQADISKGNNQIPVALNSIPAGNYIIKIVGSHTNSSMMFTVKQ